MFFDGDRSSSGSTGTAFSFGDITFPFKLLNHLMRTSGQDISTATLKRFFTAKQGNKERITGIGAAVALDPMLLQRLVHSADGDFANIGSSMYLPRDFDLFLRCSTELGHRGDYIPEILNDRAPGSAFNSTPDRYGGCPFGSWNVYRKEEPHVMSKDIYPAQVEAMEQIIDDHMSQYVGKTEEAGKVLRLLVWNLCTFCSYGTKPSETTAHMLQVFDDHSPEFDYAFRMKAADIPYEWSPSLKQQVKELNDWTTSITEERKENIDQCSHMKDVWTDTILNHSDIDLDKSEGAIRAIYLAGINNIHCAITGAMIVDSKTRGEVYNYFANDPEHHIEHIYREALRLYTSIPIIRAIREEDKFSIGGKELEPGASILLSTYAINTDPRSWDDAMEFKPSRFENTEEIGFLCQKGFAPMGISANINGRQCGGRHVAAHVIRVVLAKLLRDYKFTASGGGYFDFKQNSGATTYAGRCYVTVEKR